MIESDGWEGDEDSERWFREAQEALLEDSENFWKWCESVEKDQEEPWKVS